MSSIEFFYSVENRSEPSFMNHCIMGRVNCYISDIHCTYKPLNTATPNSTIPKCICDAQPAAQVGSSALRHQPGAVPPQPTSSAPPPRPRQTVAHWPGPAPTWLPFGYTNYAGQCVRYARLPPSRSASCNPLYNSEGTTIGREPLEGPPLFPEPTPPLGGPGV